MPLIDPVQVEGLADLNRALRAISTEAPRALRVAANEAANIVVVEARRRMPSRTGKARASVKAKSTRTAARVSSGGNRAPYVPWLDYGGKVGRNKAVKREFISDGRYVYPAYRDKKQEFERLLTDTLRRVAVDAGLA